MEAPWTNALQTGRVVFALVRHGRTEWNASQRFVGRTDIPLDPIGRQQVETLSRALPGRFSHLYSSPLSRALDTARALTPPDIVVLDDLAELNQGELEGLTGTEALERFPEFFEAWRVDPTSVPCPGGEGLEDCRRRVWSTLGELANRHSSGAVGVAAHQVVISLAVCTVLGASLSDWRKHFVGNTAVSALSFGTDGWRVEVEDWAPWVTDEK